MEVSKLCLYHVKSHGMVSILISVRHDIQYTGSGGKFEITISGRQTMGKIIEDVVILATIPKQIVNLNLVPTQGTYTYSPVEKRFKWDVGKILHGKPPAIRGSISLQTGVPTPEEKPTLLVQFVIQQLAISGIRVNRLGMYGEKYKPF